MGAHSNEPTKDGISTTNRKLDRVPADTTIHSETNFTRFDWTTDLRENISQFVIDVAISGCNASFTLSSDGGVLSVTVLDGPRKHRAYIHRGKSGADQFLGLLERCGADFAISAYRGE